MKSHSGGGLPSARSLPPGPQAARCPLEEDAAAYLLGCLEVDEDARFLAHLPVCRICQEYLASMATVLQLLEAGRRDPRLPWLHAHP